MLPSGDSPMSSPGAYIRGRLTSNTVTTGNGGPQFVLRGTPDMVLSSPPAAFPGSSYGYSTLQPNHMTGTEIAANFQVAQEEMPNEFSCANYGLPENESTFSGISAQHDSSRRVEVSQPNASSTANSQSEATSLNRMTLDTGCSTVAEVKVTGRRKYDALIDPSLPDEEKKKQRRILANRASARRSRERRKCTMQKLLEREKELKRERDAAICQLNDTVAQNMEMRMQLEILKRELAGSRNEQSRSALVHANEGFGEVTMTSAPPVCPTSLAFSRESLASSRALDARCPLVAKW